MNFTGRLIEKRESRGNMEFKVGEIIKMKKKHPCGANEWKLLRVGMDFRLQCMNCGREVMVPTGREELPGIYSSRYRLECV